MKKTVKLSTLAYNDKFTITGKEFTNKGSCLVNHLYNVALDELSNIDYIHSNYDVEIEVKQVTLEDLPSGSDFRLDLDGSIYTKLQKNSDLRNQLPYNQLVLYDKKYVKQMDSSL